MKQQTIGELTILFILLLSSARVFFIRSERKDPLSIAPLAAVVCAALSILAWGVWVQEILILALSIWVFIWNFRALLRLNENLIIDHYSPLFILISSLNCLLLAVAILFVFYFRPVSMNLGKLGVEKQLSRLCGNMADGFMESDDPLEKRTLDFIRYRASADGQATKETILFLPAECATVDLYEPFLAKLARDGYTIYSADFYSSDAMPTDSLAYRRETKRFTFVRERMANSDAYRDWCGEKKEKLFMDMFQCTAGLIPTDEKLVIVGDGLPKDLYVSLIWKDERVARCFDIANINDYKTPGWGPVEQTDPLLASTLGFSRDGALYTSNRMASVLEQMIEAGGKREEQ
ncbi:MAG: hypothetical protein ILP18_00570 [Treponema sp.]|nr:hypothetical protein [Treponema sp.]